MPVDANKTTLAKILVVGPQASGKTSLLSQYVNKMFTEQYLATLSSDFFTKQVDIAEKKVTLQLWDVSEDDESTRLYSDVAGVMLCVDVNQSYHDAKGQITKFLNKIREHINVPILIVGTKSDGKIKKAKESTPLLAKQSTPSTQVDITELAKESKLTAISTSAMKEINIEEAFNQILTLHLQCTEASITEILLQLTQAEDALGKINVIFNVSQNGFGWEEVPASVYNTMKRLEQVLNSLDMNNKEQIKIQLYQKLDIFLSIAFKNKAESCKFAADDVVLERTQGVFKAAYKTFKQECSDLLKQVNSNPELTQKDREEDYWLLKNILFGIICTLIPPLGIGIAIYNQKTTGNWCSFYKTTEKVEELKGNLVQFQNILMPR